MDSADARLVGLTEVTNSLLPLGGGECVVDVGNCSFCAYGMVRHGIWNIACASTALWPLCASLSHLGQRASQPLPLPARCALQA